MLSRLSLRYIRPYEVIETLNLVACKLDLPIELKHVRNVFRISQIKKYISNLDHAVVITPIEVSV